MKDDAELLRCFAAENSQVAFSDLVHRHLDLVYNAALRRTNGQRDLAADVAQQVFTTLARDAHKLTRHPVLSAWLHTATRNAALNLMISEQRRKTREREAGALAAAETSAPLEWQRLRPVLDAAIDELPESDRAAVVLRFLERRPFADIGAALRVSEDAARMRTDRALDKLRAALSRRGITSTAAAIGTIVSLQPLVSAPAGLAATLAQTALTAAGTSLGLAAFLSSLMTSKIIATALVSGAVAFAAGGYLALNHASHAPLPPAPELPQHSQTIASLRHQVAQLRTERDQFSAANAKLTEDLRIARTPQKAATPTTTNAQAASQERAILNNLRQLGAAIDQFHLENKRPPASLEEIVGEKKYIRRLNPVDGESYAGVSLLKGNILSVTSASGVTVTYNPQAASTAPETPAMLHARELFRLIEPAVKKAAVAFEAANSGRRPSTPEALLPYFATPQEGADFIEALEAQKEAARQNQ